jgi:phosphatidylinositol alpha-1,6-mannosyltransferase
VIAQDFFPKIGGAHLWLYEIYRRWPTPVTVLTRSYDEPAAMAVAQAEFDGRSHGALSIKRADIAMGDISLLAKRCWVRFARMVRILRDLSGAGASTVHCLRSFPEGVAGLLHKIRGGRGTRLVVYAHGEEVLIAQSSRQLRLLATLVYRHADLIIANSRSTEALVRSLCPKANIVCIHPGVDAAAYVRPREEVARFRSQWNWPAGTVVVSTIARMEPRKNHAAVIRAVAALRLEGLPLAYVCGGDGEERAALIRLVQELQLEPWVHFTGALSDDQKILTYCASDLYAMPSIRVGEVIEGFGIVFLEAAAAAIASVCGNSGGQSEAVRDGETGLVIDGLQAQQVRKAIETLVRDPALRQKMGLQAVAWAREHDWSKLTASVQQAVLAHAGRP